MVAGSGGRAFSSWRSAPRSAAQSAMINRERPPRSSPRWPRYLGATGNELRPSPAHALRSGIAQRGGGGEPIGHSDRDLSPAGAPRRVGAVPTDPAPAVLKLHQCIVGARRRDSEPDCQHGKSKGQSFRCKLPPKDDPKTDDSKPPWPRAPLKNPGRRFETSTGAGIAEPLGEFSVKARLPFVQLCPRVRFPALICRVREGSMQKNDGTTKPLP